MLVCIKEDAAFALLLLLLWLNSQTTFHDEVVFVLKDTDDAAGQPFHTTAIA